jgi:hypothetical protein
MTKLRKMIKQKTRLETCTLTGQKSQTQVAYMI